MYMSYHSSLVIATVYGGETCSGVNPSRQNRSKLALSLIKIHVGLLATYCLFAYASDDF